jgi:voltage-gated potassium channel
MPALLHRPSKWLHWLPAWALALWPQLPLSAALVISGLVNILVGFRYNLISLNQIPAITSLADSFTVLGSTTQIILGVALVLVGVGLLWRLAAAWAFAMLLLMVTIGVNVIRAHWGASLVLPGLMFLALLLLQKYFNRQTLFANYLISIISVLGILAYGTFGTYLLGDGFHPKIRELTTAFYFTIVSLGTVGYGDIVAVTPETRLFVVSLLIVGLSIFAAAIVSAVWPAVSGELTRIFSPKGERMEHKDHVILVGEGPIAKNTARELSSRGIAFIQIISQTGESSLPDYPLVRGDASDDTTLKDAGINSANMIIAARDDDGENAFISLLAKDLNPHIRVLAVATTARSMRLLKLARADLVFAPAAVGSRLLANLVEGNEISAEFQDLLEGRLNKVNP